MQTRADRAAEWVRILDEQITDKLKWTDVPVGEWKVGGRASKANPDRENLAFWQEEGLRQAEAYIAWLRANGWQIATMPDGKPGIEWEAEVQFGGSPIRLVVDAIYDVGGEWVIVDYKSGTKTPSAILQLALYASAIERAYGRRPKWGAFYMSRKAELTPLADLSLWDQSFIDYNFEAMNAYQATGYYPPVLGDHCEYRCSVSDYCIAKNGSKAKDYPLVTPTKENR